MGLDCCTRRVVGWSIVDHIRTELVVDASRRPAAPRRPEPGTIVLADRGSRCTSRLFGHRLRRAGPLGSMGAAASSVDDGLMESFWSTVQRELLDRHERESQAELGLRDLRMDRGFHDPRRRHSGLGCLGPIGCENQHTASAA